MTPPEIVDALGPFDLDPCSPINRPWPTAARHLTIDDDGLTAEWDDDEFVWCNPPYGPVTFDWMGRLADHPAGGIALIFARTETRGFTRTVWGEAESIMFVRSRLHFHRVDGTRAEANAGAPSVLVAYGQHAHARLRVLDSQPNAPVKGTLITGWRTVS